MSARDDLAILAPAPLAAVVLGEGAGAVTVTVRALKVGQLPAFARALQPLSAQIGAAIAGGLTPEAILALVAEHTEDAIAALSAATGQAPEVLREATVDQMLELLLAVIRANKDFLSGRLMTALRTAAMVNPGAGPTP